MSKENMPSFRTSMRGYNKEDINSYIKEMSGDFIAAKEEYEETIGDLEQKLEAKDREISELRGIVAERDKAAENEDASEELIAALRLRLDAMEEEIRVLRDEKTVAEARASEAERRAAEARAAEEDARSLADQVRESKLDDSNRKAEMYDRASVQIGRIMIDARENADAVIAEAEAEATRIRERAEAEVSAAKNDAAIIREQAERAALKLVNEAETKVCELCAAYAADSAGVSKKIAARYEAMIEDVCARLRGAVADISVEADKLGAAIACDCSEELALSAATLSKSTERIAADIIGSHATADYSARHAYEAAETRKKSVCSSCGSKFEDDAQKENSRDGENRFDLRDEKISLDYGAAD